MRRVWGFLVLAALMAVGPPLLLPAMALAETRVALVIGNGAYQNEPRLPNPVNDASDVAAALRRDGFDTIVATDLGKSAMDEATIRFAKAARTAEVAMFYYSGHALQFAGVNYLAPIDINLTDEADLRRMVRLDDIVADLQQAKNLRILVLDSCRDDPIAEQLKRSIGATRAMPLQRGLAKIDTPQGMIVAYATQAGRTADDGSGRNSPYTAAFLKNIEKPEEIGTIFRRISSDVYESTGHTQLPELSLSLIGEFYFKGKIEIAKEAPPADPTRADFAAAERADTVGAWDAFLGQHPEGYFGALARERRAKAADRLASLQPSSRPQGADQSQEVADGREATSDLLFWRFVDRHPSRDNLQAYLTEFPHGYFADAARAKLQNTKVASVTAEPQGTARDKTQEIFREPELRIARFWIPVMDAPNGAAGQLTELPKGAAVVVRGLSKAGAVASVQLPVTGFASANTLGRLDDSAGADEAEAQAIKAAQRRLTVAIAGFEDDADRLAAPVWGAVVADKSASFYASTARPDSATASESALDNCRKSSKPGGCYLVRMLFRTCFALARKSTSEKIWNGAIRETPALAREDAMAACTKANGSCKQSWLVCGDNRQ